MNLTFNEQESVRRQVIDKMRTRLEQTKPDRSQYAVDISRVAATVAGTMQWARAALPMIALLAALASAIRTIAAVYEIYHVTTAAGVAAIAAICFAVASDGAIFILGIAQEHTRLARQNAGLTREIATLRTIGRGVAIRAGLLPPADYNEVGDNLGLPIGIAFGFVLTTNAYIGLQPLVNKLAATSIQNFLGTITGAPADIQLTFLVDIAGVIFPPVMALIAGHQTARFAAEVAADATTEADAYEADMRDWRAMYADPLATDEGDELLQQALDIKLQAKIARRAPSEPPVQEGDTLPFEAITYQEAESDHSPFLVIAKGNGQ